MIFKERSNLIANLRRIVFLKKFMISLKKDMKILNKKIFMKNPSSKKIMMINKRPKVIIINKIIDPIIIRTILYIEEDIKIIIIVMIEDHKEKDLMILIEIKKDTNNKL
jgi:hypothetical protein